MKFCGFRWILASYLWRVSYFNTIHNHNHCQTSSVTMYWSIPTANVHQANRICSSTTATTVRYFKGCKGATLLKENFPITCTGARTNGQPFLRTQKCIFQAILGKLIIKDVDTSRPVSWVNKRMVGNWLLSASNFQEYITCNPLEHWKVYGHCLLLPTGMLLALTHFNCQLPQ